MDAEMVTEEVIIDKTLVEVTVEIEVCKTLGEIIIMISERIHDQCTISTMSYE